MVMLCSSFTKAGLKINTAEYMNIFETVMLLWINKEYDPKYVMFVQDSDLYMEPKLSEKQLPLFVLKNVWPSSSPNLNPCNYWLCSKVEKICNDKLRNMNQSLKSAIKQAF